METSMQAGVGLALGGGVVYSIAGVGVARVLEEAAIPVVAVSGTSGGAVVGAGVAAGLRGWELQQQAEEMRWSSVIRFSPGRMGLFSGEPVPKFVEGLTGCRTFADLKHPFTVVATDILRGAEVRITEGPLGLAVEASCAIPGLFRPVKWPDGKLLVDGGISDNLPVAAVRAHRPVVTIAVDVLTLSDQYQGPLRTGAHLVLKAYHTLVRRNLELTQREADFIVTPNVSGLSVLNFREAPDLIQRGREAMLPLVPRVQALLKDRLSGTESLAYPL